MKRLFHLHAAKKVLCLLLALCLLGAAFPMAAFAEGVHESSVTHLGTYHYMSNEGIDIDTIYNKDQFIYNYEWFFSDGREYSTHLSTLSSIASITSAGYYGADKADFSQHDKNVKEFLGEMKFEDIESNTYYHLESYQNSASCIAGHKIITSGDNTATLLVILPMSANYGQEWNGNFNVSESGLHKGFKAARDECLRFLKQYIIKHSITGDVKLWTAGHSRGSAIANLLGSYFALGCGDYFETCNITVSPENIYCYTFATPGTVTNKGVTKTDILSVEGNRADYPNDTAGDEYIYEADDAGTEIDPRFDTFNPVHNCRPAYDLITLLPPYQWDFTVFGKDFDITDGEASTKELMNSWLKYADIDVYNAYIRENKLADVLSTGSHGDADEYSWKKFDLSTISIINDGELTMSDMMAQRVEGLVALGRDREYYTKNYQDTFRAVFGVYGLAEKETFQSLDVKSEIGTILINYLAYATERMDNNETAAAAEVILGLYRYFTDEEIDAQSVTIKEVAKKYAALISNSFALKMLLLGAATDEIKSAVCEVMGIDKSEFFTAVDTLLKNLSSEDEVVSSVSFDALCKIILKLVSDKGDFSKIGEVIGRTPEGVYTGTGRFVDVISALLDTLLTDESGVRVPLTKKADELLAAMVVKVGTATVAKIKEEGFSEKIVSDLTGYFTTIANNVNKARNILFYILSYTDGENPYNFTKELRTVITFIAQSNKIRFAHYNESYIAWMRAQDSACNVTLGDADEDRSVSITDATVIQKAMAIIPLSHLNELAANVDRDSKIAIVDATQIQRYLNGMSCSKGIGKPIVESAE